MGDRWGLANSLDNLGVAEYFLGHWDVSLEHARAALELRRELNDRLGCIESALNLGNLMAVLGDPSAAERSYSEASRGAAELGDPRKAARALLSRACLRLSAGDHPGVNQLLATFRDLGIEEPSLRARRLLLEGLSTRGTGGADPESLLREALAEAVRAGSVPEQASVRLALARTCRAAARWEEARGHIQEALILVGAGRVPLLELEAMRLAAALGADMTPPLGSDPAATERVRALRAALAEPVPTELKGHANFEHPLFPLP
jgi:tetratricopeptide (TPR) repeat protein